MGKKTLTDAELLHTYDTYIHCGGSIHKTARTLKLNRATIRNRLELCQKKFNLEYKKPVVGGKIHGLQIINKPLPKKGEVKRYILTCAQNNTHIHTPFWNNLKVYAEHINAEILVSQFTYNKSAYGQKSVKPGKGPTQEDLAPLHFAPELGGYFCNDRVQLAPDLVFCGEVNILPTAARPLSGFETYTRDSSGIFPHTTFAMESIPVYAQDYPKINYTTGCVTVKNYIQKKAGLKAEFHHAYGALVVEVLSDGCWFVRQLNAEEDGSFYDLDIYVQDEEIQTNIPVEAINWGDVHVETLDPQIMELNWGKGGLLDSLQPAYQFMHDTVDFHARNHHRLKDPHAMYKRFIEGQDSVEKEFQNVVTFLNHVSYRDWCKTIVVDSNHDNALERWLREADYRQDPLNAIFFLKTQLAKFEAIRTKNANFHIIEHALRKLGCIPEIQFLRDCESFTICGQIECGMHGHLGPNGAKGSPLGISKIGRKTNTGHTHSAGIVNGAYVAGTSTLLQLEYNKGPSSWSHSHIVTYQNGKRCIITVRNGRWRG